MSYQHLFQQSEYQMENLTEKVNKELSKSQKSISDLAIHLGVSEYGLRKMLKRGTLKSDIVMKMVKFLNVDLSFFGMKSTENSGNIGGSQTDEVFSKKVEYLERVIATKDEVIRAKDEIIATLREKLKK